MSITTTLYGAGKGFVGRLPPWLLRGRPYAVYAIDTADARTADDQADGDGATRWATSRDEVETLSCVTDRTNLQRWDGRQSRVVCAIGDDGAPVGAAWIATHRFTEPELGVSIALADDEAWLHSAFIRPEHRRRGHYATLLNLATTTLAAEGFRRLLLGVTLGNAPSRIAHERAGATPIGRIDAVRLLGVRIVNTAGDVRTTRDRRFVISPADVALRVATP